MKKAILIVSALLLIFGGSAFAFEMRTGYFVGSGIARSITNLGISPDLVIIKADTAAGRAVWRSTAMPGDSTAYFENAAGNDTGLITALDSNGFSIGTNANVNSANIRYTWVAFSGTGGLDFKVGSYSGNGTDDRNITDLGFQPNLLWIKRNGASLGVWYSSAMGADNSHYFSATAPTANRIQSLLANGFQIGTDAETNASGSTYFYVAFKNVPNSLSVGSYNGNAADNRSITGLGFQPDFTLIKQSAAANPAVIRGTQNYGDETQLFTAAANVLDSIQSLEADGFQIGTNARVNANAITYYYVAFKGIPIYSPTGTFKMISGSFLGNGTSQSITGVGYKPDYVMIKADNASAAVFTTSLMAPNSTAYYASTTANFADGITSLDNDGFSIGSSALVNSNSIWYRWIAFYGTGSANYIAGAYTGTGGDNRSITGLGFQPDYVAIKSTGANLGVFRTSAIAGDATAYFSLTADTADRIQSLEADGFQIGTNAEVNTAGATYFYLAYKNTPGQFITGGYTGDGVDNRSLTGFGFRPGLTIAKRPEITAASVFRGANLSGDNTQYFTLTANAANIIQALESDGLQMGTDAAINANAITYRYAAWKTTSTKLAVITQPVTTTAGSLITPEITIAVQDPSGNTDSSDNTTQVTISIGSNPGGSTLSGTTVKTVVSGLATFENLSLDKVGTGYTLTATATSLTSATTGQFSISHGATSKLAFSSQPSAGTAGTSISPAVTILVQDAYGNTVTANNTTEVTTAIGSNPGGATLSGTLTRIATAGVISFNDLSLEKAATGYTLSAIATGLASALSNSFNVNPAAANKLIFTTQPATTSAGSLLTPAVVVAIKDQYDNLVTGDNSTAVSLTLDTNPGGGSLFGSTTITAVSGEARFNDLYLNKNGDYRIRAEASGLTVATSGAFSISGTLAPPTISAIYPASGAGNIAPNAGLVITFSQEMDKSTTAAALLLKPISDNLAVSLDAAAISGSTTWDATSKTLYFTPAGSLSKGYTYRVTISTNAQNANLIALATSESWLFTATYDHTKANALTSLDGKVKVTLNSGALPFDGYININRDPRTNPIAVDPNQIVLANSKVAAEGDPNHYPLLGSITEFLTYNADGTRSSTRFADAVTIVFFYDDIDNDGIVDGTSPPVSAADLALFRLDESHGLWVKVPGSVVNLIGHYVSAPVNSFSVYALMANPAASAASPYAFPNPFKPSAGHSTVTFTNLPAQCVIKIFTLSGELAKTINETNGTGQYVWDVKNESGEGLASGLYLYVIKSNTETKTGKLVIIK
ncbi:MAG: Ig-like domain-containing protein [Syntrophales bacterium]